MKIIKATHQDSKVLTELTKRSKAIWGYNENLMNQWSDELTITEQYLNDNTVYVLKSDTLIIGYYSIIQKANSVTYLDNLFVDPKHMNKGYGTLLLSHSIQWCKKHQILIIELHSDPYADEFYFSFGFEIIGKKLSSIPGRYLSHMRYTIKMEDINEA